MVAESLQQNSNKEEQDTASDAPDFMLEEEEVEDPTPGTKVCTFPPIANTNDIVAKSFPPYL